MVYFEANTLINQDVNNWAEFKSKNNIALVQSKQSYYEPECRQQERVYFSERVLQAYHG